MLARCSWLAALMLVARVLSAAAQTFTPGGLPIDISTTPRLVAPNGTVTISGTISGYNRGGSVSITISPPQRPPVSLVAALGTDGRFTSKFSATDLTGTYAVRAVAPDGKGIDTDSFSVMTYSAMADAHVQTLTRVFQLVGEGSAAARKVMLASPPAPPRDQMLDTLSVLDDSLKRWPEAVKAYGAALKGIGKAAEAHGEVASIAGAVFDKLNPIADELTGRLSDVAAQLAAAKRVTQFCEDLTLLQDALTALSWATNLTTKLTTTLLNVAISTGTPAAVDKLAGQSVPAPAKAAITSALKVAAGIMTTGTDNTGKLKPVNWHRALFTIVTDAAAYLGNAVFDRFCERFEGPLAARLQVDLNQNAKPWLKYGIRLDGKLVVNYSKTGAGGRIPVVGYFEGNAVEYSLWENVDLLLPMMEPKYRTPPTVRLLYTPETNPYMDELGGFIRAGTIGYFRVPVSGELSDGKLALIIEQAATDFTDRIAGKLVLIWFIPIAPFVHVETATIPFQKARFIIARGIQDPVPKFNVAIDKAANRSVVEHTFTRDHKDPAADIRVQFEIKVKACNPRCM